MKQINYFLVDVFTNKKFGGNQLAVIPDAQDLSEHEMQNITKELNLSETTFVTSISENTAKLRIFTPKKEVPYAGHPTIGTAHLLASNQFLPLMENQTEYIFQELSGDLTIQVFSKDNIITKITMNQPIAKPQEIPVIEKQVAQMLDIDPLEISTEYPIQILSAGVPFLIVPLDTVETVKKINFRKDIWKQLVQNRPTFDIYAFAPVSNSPHPLMHTRMFGPSMDIEEDPATGAASGVLGAYLASHKIIKPNNQNVVNFTIEQGIEIERPSNIEVSIKISQEKISEVQISGSAITIGSGELWLD